MSEPAFAICQFTTFPASFDEDLDAYHSAGAMGIGLCEVKLPPGGDAASVSKLAARRLKATTCVPAVPSILPAPAMEGPADPADRVDAICASVRRLAAFEPIAVNVLTGPAGRFDAAEARRIVVDGLRRIAREADGVGVRVGLEPLSPYGADAWTTITSIRDAAELIEAAGEPALGITFDVWHLWDSETLEEDIRAYAGLITGAHVCDWREPTRSWCDRVLPGDGVAGVPRIVGLLDAAGFAGPYDLEVFSDNGTFGNAFDDSLWNLPAHELARRGREAFLRAWGQVPHDIAQ